MTASQPTNRPAVVNSKPSDRVGRGFSLVAGIVFGAGLTMMIASGQAGTQPTTSVLPPEPVDLYFVTQANADGSQVHLWKMPKEAQAPNRRVQIELVDTFQAVSRGRR